MSFRAVVAQFLILLGALWLVRAQLLGEVGVTPRRAWELGLACGLSFDLALALLAAGAGICIGARRPWLANGIVLGASIVLFLFSVANVAYFGYFDARLEPWVIESHLRDIPAIAGSVRSVLGAPILIACVIAISLIVVVARWARRRERAPALPARVGLWLLLAASVLLPITSVIKRRTIDGSSILAEQVFVVWVEARLGWLPHYELARRGIERTMQERAGLDPTVPSAVLATWRDWDAQAQPHPVESDFEAARSLVRELSPDPARTRALRERLGLPPEGPIHVIVLFLESVRAFEMEHPKLWPRVFPKTRALLASHALRFPTAYASAPDVGKTVQGQFATLCSLLPNFDGAAVYTSHPHLRVKSLAEVARDNGYRTLWISGGSESFHNKRVFEASHGTESFFGYEVLRDIPFEGTPSECGYPDGPMLREAVKILERESRNGQALFANVLTLSTHHPVSEIPEGPVPAQLLAAAKKPPAGKDYAGYLSRLRYLDESLPPFFEALFAGPLGERVLVVMLGDHGQRYRPHLRVSQHQMVELMSRIPFAFVTKHLPSPGELRHAVHQIDVAPTVADIVGLRGEVAWIGRNLLEGSGSPWVVAEKERLHYRVGDRVAYTLQGENGPRTFRLAAGEDPLFRRKLTPTPPDVDEVHFFQSVAIAARQAITLNLVMPEQGR